MIGTNRQLSSGHMENYIWSYRESVQEFGIGDLKHYLGVQTFGIVQFFLATQMDYYFLKVIIKSCFYPKQLPLLVLAIFVHHFLPFACSSSVLFFWKLSKNSGKDWKGQSLDIHIHRHDLNTYKLHKRWSENWALYSLSQKKKKKSQEMSKYPVKLCQEIQFSLKISATTPNLSSLQIRFLLFIVLIDENYLSTMKWNFWAFPK